jgi:hypothetical protein
MSAPLSLESIASGTQDAFVEADEWDAMILNELDESYHVETIQCRIVVSGTTSQCKMLITEETDVRIRITSLCFCAFLPVMLLILLLGACSPQGIRPFLTPSPIRISDRDRLTPETRAQIDLINVQIEQMRIMVGNRQRYMALPLP